MTLTSDSLQQFMVSIPIDKLSACFRDAMYATIGLGYQYLWIDSLCIIQNDPADWEKESKSMADVYRNAVCNLSASDFKSGINGLSPERRVNNPIPPRIPIGVREGRMSFVVDAQLTKEICNGPIFSRAWVLQEQVLVSNSYSNFFDRPKGLLPGKTRTSFRP